MTASTMVLCQPKGILLRSRDGAQQKGKRSVSTCSISKGKRAFVSSGKLKNLRNHYAQRRRSSLSSQESSTSSAGNRIIVTPEQRRRSLVRFAQGIAIHEIPSRKDYSKEEKSDIWMPRQELKRLILKNHTEFAYEGRDWRNAPEEHEFDMDAQGQPLHPAYKQENSLPAPPKTTAKRPPAAAKKRKNRLCLRKLPMSKQMPQESCSSDSAFSIENEGQENKRPRLHQ